MIMMRSWLFALLVIHHTTSATPAFCPCGYRVNSIQSTNGTQIQREDVFTEALETDFLHVYTLPTLATSTAERIEDFGWQAQAYNVSPGDARGPLGKSAQVENVVVNPLPSEEDWTGSGLDGGDPGLQLWVRSASDLQALDVSGSPQYAVKSSELASLRRDMLYGSYRVGMKMSDVNGTCAAFFWYRSDTSELDLEFLSRQINLTSSSSPAPLNLVLQTPLSASRGFDASETPYYHVAPLPFLPSAGYHEYRIDWSSDRVTFYADGMPLWTVTDQTVIPDGPGHLILNHWSNGNLKWSAGPPQTDSKVTVSYVKAYFNSSDPVRRASFAGNCTSGQPTCTIEDINWAQGIDPKTSDGGTSGRTPFVLNRTGWTDADSEGASGRVEVGMGVLGLATVVGSLFVFGEVFGA